MHCRKPSDVDAASVPLLETTSCFLKPLGSKKPGGRTLSQLRLQVRVARYRRRGSRTITYVRLNLMAFKCIMVLKTNPLATTAAYGPARSATREISVI